MKTDLTNIPNVGKRTKESLNNIGIACVEDLVGKDPEDLYIKDCLKKGFQVDKCQLYLFRMAVYYAENSGGESEKLKWWYWKDKEYPEKEQKNMISLIKEEYAKNPCKASSLPYWKTKITAIPETMKIVHNDEFDCNELSKYFDEPYFRLKHDLREIQPINIPDGFSITNASVSDFVKHINSCYDDTNLSISELKEYTKRPVYKPELWLAVNDNTTGKIVASGIAEFDKEVNEGILEWIQVSENYRGQKLGQYVVTELLMRMKEYADFVTVSGKINNPTKPEILYRNCGFKGNDVWHILKCK